MMELLDIPGMSQILRICKFGTCNHKNTKVDLRDPNRVLKIGPPKIWVSDQFSMVGGPLRGKNYPQCKKLSREYKSQFLIWLSMTKDHAKVFNKIECSYRQKRGHWFSILNDEHISICQNLRLSQKIFHKIPPWEDNFTD